MLSCCGHLQYTEEGTCRFPQTLPAPPMIWILLVFFLTGKRSDAAVVGSGNKAMGKSSLLTFCRALGAEKPTTKRPRSYMEGPRGGKTNCKTSKKTYMEGCFPQLHPPRRGGARARARARAHARPPPSSGGVPSARAGFFLYIYLSISTYLSLCNIYICIYIPLSLSLSLSF